MSDLFPSRRARFLVHKRKALGTIMFMELALRVSEPYALLTLYEGWFELNDTLIKLRKLTNKEIDV